MAAVTFEVRAGDTIQYATVEAIRLAKHRRKPVKFDFNGRSITVKPDSNAVQVMMSHGFDPEPYDPIPKTVADALSKWDANESVFVPEMGGLGPGYEMAIQGLAFELMRVWKDFKNWNARNVSEQLDVLAKPVIAECDRKSWGGFSGAQVGAAENFAARVCRVGYRTALRELPSDRLIQCSKRDLRSGVLS